VGVDADGQVADHVFIDSHRPLELSEGCGRRLDIQQHVMPFAILSHPVGKIAQPPIFSLLDFAGIVREELGERVCEGIDLRA
jgi:hypothetical protein